MKKSIVILGAVAIVLLMVSTSTAIPQTNSKPVMEKVEKLENQIIANLIEQSNLPQPKPFGWGRLLILLFAIGFFRPGAWLDRWFGTLFNLWWWLW